MLDLKIGIKGNKSTKQNKSEAMEIDTTQITEVPRLEPMPCKPVFFDLALNHIKMPSMNSRIRELSEKEKPPTKQPQPQQQTSKKQGAAPQKPASKNAKKGPAAAKKTAEAPQEQQEEQAQGEQAGIGSKIKNLFWGFK
uniref:Uncharacterized protein n=1 Tax=Panagrolaimus superbus TaxID=310955 RepID=A0A914Y569_9BILA